jgi:hypothetical protein
MAKELSAIIRTRIIELGINELNTLNYELSKISNEC